jgi:hypothetical protein
MEDVCSVAAARVMPQGDDSDRLRILARYQRHRRRFEEMAARRHHDEDTTDAGGSLASVVQVVVDPTSLELEVLQLIADGHYKSRVRRATLHLRRDREVARAPAAHQTPRPLTRACGRNRLPSRPD